MASLEKPRVVAGLFFLPRKTYANRPPQMSVFCSFVPVVYLEVRHPCLSCKFSSSSANASAGVRWPSMRMGRLSVSSTISWSPLAIPGSMIVRLGRQRRMMPLTGGGDQPLPGHSSTRAHRRPNDRRYGLRGFALRRSALRCAGPAM